jgi:aminoglycoside 2''-phosphotransferase
VPTNNRPTFLSDLDLDQIRKALQHTFPYSRPDSSRIKLLNDGFSSYVVLVADEFILRIAKHAEAMAGHIKEQAILPVLQKHLPIQIPQPTWRVEPSDHFPFGAIGYRRILGTPFSLSLAPHVKLDRLAQDLAQFLGALHNVPLDEMTAVGFKIIDELESLRAEVMPTLYTYLTEAEYEKIRTWWESYLNNPVKESFTPKLIHGDPWGENIILGETLDSIVGVVDFETVSIGDVAQDFAAQKYLGPDFLSRVLEHYQQLGGELENHFATRLQGWSMLRELRGLGYAIRYPGSSELVDSLQKVRYELSLSA